MKSNIPLCVILISVISVVLVSGCLSKLSGLEDMGDLDLGGGAKEVSTGVGYGPSGGSAGGTGNASAQGNNTAPAGAGTPSATAEADWVAAGLNSCGNAKDLLIEMPLANGDFMSITPLGNLNPSGHTFPTDHVYFMLNRLNEFVAAQAFVISPADAWVTRIASSEHVSDNFTDYTIDFSTCKEVVFRFGHMSSLSERLVQNLSANASVCNEYETGGKRFRDCETGVMVKVSASEVIGTAGGNEGQFALDMWAYDSRTAELNYANKARWYGRQMHVACPLNYFKAEMKELLETMLMSEGGTIRTVPPVCGEVEQDEPATAQGVWFLKSTKNTYPEDPHIALVHDNFNPMKGAFSIGTSMQTGGLASGVYYFEPVDIGYVNRDFAGVRAGGMAYCYETAKSGDGRKYVILVQLTGAAAIRMERLQSDSCGSGPWSFAEGVDFER